jgi:hypothetical protein
MLMDAWQLLRDTVGLVGRALAFAFEFTFAKTMAAPDLKAAAIGERISD